MCVRLWAFSIYYLVWLLSSLRLKAKVFTMTYKTPCDPVTTLTSSVITLPSSLFALATLMISLKYHLEYSSHASALGSSNWLLPLCDCLPPDLPKLVASPPLSLCPNVLCSEGGYHDRFTWSCNHLFQPQYSWAPLTCSLFFYNSYYPSMCYKMKLLILFIFSFSSRK